MEKKPTTKRYPPELKERAVRMVLDLREQDPHDKTVISRVARQLGVGDESLRSLGQAGRRRRRQAPGTDERGAGRAQAAAQGELRAAPGQRHLAGRGKFLRGGARPPTQEVVTFIDAHRDRDDRWASMGGRADLRGPRRSPPPPTTTPSPGHRRPGRSVTPSSDPPSSSAVEAQLLGLRAAQADQGGPPGRPRRRSGPGGAAHALPGHPGRQPGQEALHHQVRPRARPGPGPRQPQLHAPAAPTSCGCATSPTARRGRASSTSPSSSTSSPGASSAGRRRAR